MTTITIDNPSIEEKYTKSELKLLVLNFLESRLKEDTIEMFEISIEDLTEEQLQKYNNRNNHNYINL